MNDLKKNLKNPSFGDQSFSPVICSRIPLAEEPHLSKSLDYSLKKPVFELNIIPNKIENIAIHQPFVSWVEISLIPIHDTSQTFFISMKELHHSFSNYLRELYGKDIRMSQIPSLLYFSRNFSKMYKSAFNQEVEIKKYKNGLNLVGFILKSESHLEK